MAATTITPGSGLPAGTNISFLEWDGNLGAYTGAPAQPGELLQPVVQLINGNPVTQGNPVPTYMTVSGAAVNTGSPLPMAVISDGAPVGGYNYLPVRIPGEVYAKPRYDDLVFSIQVYPYQLENPYLLDSYMNLYNAKQVGRTAFRTFIRNTTDVDLVIRIDDYIQGEILPGANIAIASGQIVEAQLSAVLDNIVLHKVSGTPTAGTLVFAGIAY